ncbi:hypothetical protein, partial [Secundilactobacillus odoratitofui]|uniref:hypothetical protein n=1 Tax=Secundilactobacillus odoratitofui TaxID=480930 RepID=UPI000B327346
GKTTPNTTVTLTDVNGDPIKDADGNPITAKSTDTGEFDIPVTDTEVTPGQIVTATPDKGNQSTELTVPVPVDYTVTPVTADGKPISNVTPTHYNAKPGTTVSYPDVKGYTVRPNNETVPTVENGNVNVTYTPNPVNAPVTIPTDTTDGNNVDHAGTATVPGVTGVTGQTVTVNVPTKKGYTPTADTITATIEPDGSIKPNETVTYTADGQNGLVEFVDADNPTHKLAEDQTVEGKTDGYIDHTAVESEIQSVLAQNYNLVSDQTVSKTFNPDTGENVFVVKFRVMVDATYTTVPVDANGNDIPGTTATPETGALGTEISYPDVPGYEVTTNPGTVPTDGGNAKVVYTPTTHAYSITPVDESGNPIPDTKATPKTGTTATVITDFPTVEGYTPKTGQDVEVPTTDTSVQVVYVPNTVDTTVTIPSNYGDLTVEGVTGKTGQTVEVNVPAKQGYTTNKTTVPGVVNPDGTISITETIVYTPNTVTGTVTVPSNLGDVNFPDLTGVTGQVLEVPVPAQEGYTSEPSVVQFTINPDGTITTTTTNIDYVPNQVTGDVTLDSNLGNLTVNNVTGKTGQTIVVDVPQRDGYTSDKQTVTAIVEPDGTIKVTEPVTYTETDDDTATAPTDKQAAHNLSGAQANVTTVSHKTQNSDNQQKATDSRKLPQTNEKNAGCNVSENWFESNELAWFIRTSSKTS